MSTNIFQSKRFKWMVDAIHDSLEITSKHFSVEDLLKSEKYHDHIKTFFDGTGPSKILFYFQHNDSESKDDHHHLTDLNFFMTSGEEEPLLGKGLYFLRVTEKPINLNDIDGDVIFGEIVPDCLPQLNLLISAIFQPLVENMKREDWGECDEEQRGEFLALTDGFAREINGSLNSLLGNVDKCKINPTVLEPISSEAERNLYFEDLFGTWLQYFQQIVHSSSMENSRNVTEGPRSELVHWRKVLQESTLLLELTRSKDFQLVRNTLSIIPKKPDDRKIKLLNDFKVIENTLTERLNEAKDNVKYLSTLEKLIEPFYNGTTEEIIETLPGLMNAIKMIHTISRYYNTSGKMTLLFSKITYQMIQNCKARIINQSENKEGSKTPDAKGIWKIPPEKLIDSFNVCINLFQKYRASYEATKKKAAELPKSRHWDFDEAVIFGKFELFVKRIRKLTELFSTIQQFYTLEKHSNLEGLPKLIGSFKAILEDFKTKSHNLLEFENVALEKDYVELMQKIQTLDNDLQIFIDSNFSKLKNISYSLKLLKKFEVILKRDNIRNKLINKYETILQNYGAEIDSIQKTFDEHKGSPPILRNMPPDAGKIIWVRHLFGKLYGPIDDFPSNLISSKEMKKYIDKYNLIGQNLIIYELYFTQSWCNDIDRAKACLQSTLLVVKETNGVKKLRVNFEKDIQKLLREAKALDREGIGNIPESAKIILLQEEKFKRYYYQLDFLRSEYDRVIGSIKPIMKVLLIPHVEDMDLKLRPGMVTLTWTSMNIDFFVDKSQKGLQRLERLISSLNDIIDNRIENNLKMIGNIILVKLPQDSRSMSLDEFVETQQEHIYEKAETLISKNNEIERSVDDLLRTVLDYKLDKNVDEIDIKAVKIVKQFYFWYFYQALLNATQNSLNQMKDRIGEKSGSGESKSFFEVNVILEDDSIKLIPSLEDIQKAINRAATAVLSCSKRMIGWDQINSDENKESYYRIIAQDREIVKVILLLTGSIQRTKSKIQQYLTSFEKYNWLWTQSISAEITRFKKSSPDLRKYEEQLKKFTLLEQEIDQIEKNRNISALSLKTESLINALKAKCKEWKNNYAEDLHIKAKETLTVLTENIKNYSVWISKEVREIDSLGQVMASLEDIRKEQSEIELKFAPIFDMYALLDNYLPGGINDKEEMDNRQLLKKKWTDLTELADQRQKELQKDQSKNLKKLKENIKQLISDVKILRKNFVEEGPMVQGISPKEASDRLKRFENEYELKKAFYEINKRGEDLFGLMNQKYPELELTKDQIQNLNQLYALYNQVNETTTQWEEEAWSEIQVSKMKEWEDFIGKFADDCFRLPKSLREWPAYKDLKEKIENYKNVFPYIKELKEPMVKNRHWEKIIEVSNKQLNYLQPDNFYFKELIDANLMECIDEVEDIIDSAKKQDKIEKTKNEIKSAWHSLEFEFKEWGLKRKVPILSGAGVEKIQERLDEDISTLSGLGAMRHVGPFKEEVQNLQEMLIDVQTSLDLWVKVQILWTSLERVFTEGDISVILTNESKRFAKIDKLWVKTIMEKATEQKKVKLCCQNEVIKSILPNLQEELEGCQKQLEKYLEMKRKSFPRFYFVSDLVLLKFLSQGSDPESVQEDFDKLFDAISKVTFVRGDKNTGIKNITEIKSGMSSEEEVVALTHHVACADLIEKWLLSLEKSMQYSIKQRIKKAIVDILPVSFRDPNFNFEYFINQYPAQIVLLGLQVKWTKLVQDALEKKSSERNKSINEAKHEVDKIIDILTDMCRKDLGGPMKRQKIETLVTIMVYLKEVTMNWRFKDANDFEWQKYTRIYLMDDDICRISITDWNAEYSNEYLGVKERLCITPLTDRCYISLAQAMSMYYGGAPAGPAGTGKTETVKDMGRTLGIFVVVTNCSPEHRYTDMAKIFKGLCQSGLWGCFDEFNRIDLEVLSVVAMQVESITSAKKEGKLEFSFPDEQENIKLISSCGYFITMNPGYAGRQELPENLKVFFRGVTMMVPDREVIIRVKLAGSGYKEYTELAKKFKVLYGLCEEQLSKQKHYDFGLRNILSVLRTAGNELRKNSGTMTEEQLMIVTLSKMNLSKLVAEDVPLFNDLMRDIFPKVTAVEEKTKDDIKSKIREKVVAQNLDPFPPWILKVNQVYDTSLVRHGFMLVGPSCTGKTTIINILIDVLSSAMDGKKYMIQKLNPKAFTAQEMYGVKNFAGEWTPGIFSEMWRKANDKKPNKPNTWIVCDGPVDTLWIENLNTVLDDNKVLTLANGDRIFMLDTVKMVFEVENLNNASPATVSRCGQIYVSPNDLGYDQIIKGWIGQRTKEDSNKNNAIITGKQIAEKLFNRDDSEKVLNLLLKYFNHFKVLDEFEDAAKKNKVIDIDASLKVLQTLKILGGLISHFQGTKNGTKIISLIDYEKIVIFALAWGLSGSYEMEERLKFQDFLKNIREEKIPLPQTLNNEISIFDYQLCIDEKGVDWKLFTVEKWRPPKQIYFSRLLMPTLDSTRAEILIDTLMNSGNSVLLVGGAGTAKTSSMLMYANKFDKDKMMLHRINFSSATQPVHFQTSIESICDTKVRKGFGPKDGKMMTVFIDDLSMPQKNDNGDQITLEIVRQIVEDSGFYRLEKNERGNFKFIENLRYTAAMNQPGGGRNDIPNRLKHHFVIFNMILPSKIDVIYNPILYSMFGGIPEVKDSRILDNLCNVTLKLFNDIKADLLPTPSKFHYLFNLRDVSRIFKGMCQVRPKTINNYCKASKGAMKHDVFMIGLWRYECERVFIDKLVNEQDKQKIATKIQNHCNEAFGQLKDYPEFWTKGYFFCDFMQQPTCEEDTPETPVDKMYEYVDDIERLRAKAMALLRRYNEELPQKKMDLVLFDDALLHLVKISRIIQMPRSSALLVGVGGSGKQSLTRLAAKIGNHQVFQIQLTKSYNEGNLKEDIKNLFDIAGHKGNNITFILTDAEVKSEVFLEYINMALSTGEIPGLLQKDEKEVWLGDVRTDLVKISPKDKGEPSSMEVYDFFLNRLRDNLHIVLCFSPVGTKFRERARKFPALFNECNIDWFLPWPEEALSSVAQSFLQNFKELEAKEEIKAQLPKWMAQVHIKVNLSCEEYLSKMRRSVFVTPKSYISFIRAYQTLYKSKFIELDHAEKNYKTGLEKIYKARKDIAELEQDLKREEEKVRIKKEEVEKIIIELNIEREKANQKNEEVSTEKQKIQIEKTKVEIDKESCERELKDSLPALEKAQAAANQVSAKELNDLKPILTQNAHIVMKYVVDAIQIVLYQKVRNDIIMLDKPIYASKKQEKHHLIEFFQDSWDLYGKQSFFDPLMAEKLQMMAKTENENLINGEILELLEPYTRCKDTWLSKELAMNAFNKMGLIHDWMVQIEKFSIETRNIKPKRIALKQAENKLAVAAAKLEEAETQLAEIQLKCNNLNSIFKEKNGEKNDLEETARRQKRRIEQANRLLNSLADERERWNKGADELAEFKRRLIGNVGVSTAFISYCGPFNAEFRDYIANSKLIADLKGMNIPHSPTIYHDLTNFLVDEATTGQWNIDGLPKDTLSIQNGIMVESSERYPLLIDPQNQGAVWIKNKFRDINPETGRPYIVVININEEKKFRDALPRCVENGEILIIEGIESEVDPILDPVLEKQFIEKGSKSKNAEGKEIHANRVKYIITIAGTVYDYNKKFKLFLTCKLGNPKFSPELSAKTTIIDFTVTQTGLEQQLLSVVLSKKQRILEESLNALLKEVTMNKKELKKLDESLLDKLTKSTGNLLDDSELIEILNMTKTQAKEMQVKLADAEIKTSEINEKRCTFRPVAVRGSVLYFCMIEIAQVSWMYNSSLNQFLSLYNASIDNSPKTTLPAKDVENILRDLSYSVYRYVNRGLFEKDKITFLLMVCFKILITDKKLSSDDAALFLKAGAVVDKSNMKPKPSAEWLTDKVWMNVMALSNHKFQNESAPFFKSLPEFISNSIDNWKKWAYERADPENAPIPEYEERFKSEADLGEFLRFCLVRCLREDRTITASSRFLQATLGEARYTDPVTDTIDSIHAASSPREPILFLLSAGADPTASIDELAKKRKRALWKVSLGEGQEKKAESLVFDSFEKGDWVLLQNCHLGLNFMSYLDTQLADDEWVARANPEFRIWMSCEPRAGFPLGLLQKAIKVTNEPPKGVKAGLYRTFSTIVNSEFLERIDHSNWRTLVYATCFIHSVVQERRKFGPLGWCIPYEYNYSDLEASLAFTEKYLNQLQAQLERNDPNKNFAISWSVLIFMVCQIQYGGRITDNLDRELFNSYGEIYFRESLLGHDPLLVKISNDLKYSVPHALEHKTYLEYIETMPSVDNPELFGLNANADITFRLKDTNEMIATIMETRPKDSGRDSGKSREEIIQGRARELLNKLIDEDIDIKDAIKRLPGPKGSNDKGMAVPLNIFLYQEIQRIRKVMEIVKKTLRDIDDAVSGQIIMTPDIVNAIDAIFDGKIPHNWVYDPSKAEISWLKPSFALWFEMLLERNAELAKWLKGERPKAFNLSWFFNPQGFLTAMKQEIVRANKNAKANAKQTVEWSMDNVEYQTTVFTEKQQREFDNGKDFGGEGVLIQGLFLEGCRWSRDGLQDSSEKKMVYPMNIVHVTAVPTNSKKGLDQEKRDSAYNCPVYKYPSRQDNYLIFRVLLPYNGSGADQNKWKLRGVALLCSTD